MHASYRADLRDLNELNFAHFDAKQEQRRAQVKSDLVKWMSCGPLAAPQPGPYDGYDPPYGDDKWRFPE